jgi:undecaprenyl-diphosphatase
MDTLGVVDFTIFKAVNGFAADHDAFEDLFRFFAVSAQYLFAGLLAAAFLAQGRWRSVKARHGIVAAGLAALLALGLAHVITMIWDRPRPYEAHPGVAHLFIDSSSDSSFPSDHATAAFAIAVSILLRNKGLGLIVLAMATLVSVSRVVVGTHYPSDVLAGALLGTFAAFVLWTPPIRGYLRRLALELSAFYDRLSAKVLGRPSAAS